MDVMRGTLRGKLEGRETCPYSLRASRVAAFMSCVIHSKYNPSGKHTHFAVQRDCKTSIHCALNLTQARLRLNSSLGPDEQDLALWRFVFLLRTHSAAVWLGRRLSTAQGCIKRFPPNCSPAISSQRIPAFAHKVPEKGRTYRGCGALSPWVSNALTIEKFRNRRPSH